MDTYGNYDPVSGFGALALLLIVAIITVVLIDWIYFAIDQWRKTRK